MAVLIKEERAVSAWLAAARHLVACPEYTDRNLILEMASGRSSAGHLFDRPSDHECSTPTGVSIHQ